MSPAYTRAADATRAATGLVGVRRPESHRAGRQSESGSVHSENPCSGGVLIALSPSSACLDPPRPQEERVRVLPSRGQCAAAGARASVHTAYSRSRSRRTDQRYYLDRAGARVRHTDSVRFRRRAIAGDLAGGEPSPAAAAAAQQAPLVPAGRPRTRAARAERSRAPRQSPPTRSTSAARGAVVRGAPARSARARRAPSPRARCLLLARQALTR